MTDTAVQPMPPAAHQKFVGLVDMSAYFRTSSAHLLPMWRLFCPFNHKRCGGQLGKFLPWLFPNGGTWEWIAILPAGFVQVAVGCYALGNHARRSRRHAPRRPRMGSMPSSMHVKRDASNRIVFENAAGVRELRLSDLGRDARGRLVGSQQLTDSLLEGYTYFFECPRCFQWSSIRVDNIVSRPLVARYGLGRARRQTQRTKGGADS